ncbi:MAG: hypothetical protein R3Y62_01045 [Eubacteriales bacterium]
MFPLATVQSRIGQICPNAPWRGLTPKGYNCGVLFGETGKENQPYDDLWLQFLALQQQAQVQQIEQSNVTQIALKILMELNEQWTYLEENQVENSRLWRTLQQYTTYLQKTGATQATTILALQRQVEQLCVRATITDTNHHRSVTTREKYHTTTSHFQDSATTAHTKEMATTIQRETLVTQENREIHQEFSTEFQENQVEIEKNHQQIVESKNLETLEQTKAKIQREIRHKQEENRLETHHQATKKVAEIHRETQEKNTTTRQDLTALIQSELHHNQVQMEGQIRQLERWNSGANRPEIATHWNEKIHRLTTQLPGTFMVESTAQGQVTRHRSRLLEVLVQTDQKTVETLWETLTTSSHLTHVQRIFFQENSRFSKEKQVKTFLQTRNKQEYVEVVNLLKQAIHTAHFHTENQTKTLENSNSTVEYTREIVHKQVEIPTFTTKIETRTEILPGERTNIWHHLSHQFHTATDSQRKTLLQTLEQATKTVTALPEIHTKTASRQVTEPGTTMEKSITEQVVHREIIQTMTPAEVTYSIGESQTNQKEIHQFSEKETVENLDKIVENQRFFKLITTLAQAPNLPRVVEYLETSTVFHRRENQEKLTHRLRTVLAQSKPLEGKIILQSMGQQEGAVLLQYLQQAGVAPQTATTMRAVSALRNVFRQYRSQEKQRVLREVLEDFVSFHSSKTLTERTVSALKILQQIHTEKNTPPTVTNRETTVEKESEIWQKPPPITLLQALELPLLEPWEGKINSQEIATLAPPQLQMKQVAYHTQSLGIALEKQGYHATNQPQNRVEVQSKSRLRNQPIPGKTSWRTATDCTVIPLVQREYTTVATIANILQKVDSIGEKTEKTENFEINNYEKSVIMEKTIPPSHQQATQVTYQPAPMETLRTTAESTKLVVEKKSKWNAAVTYRKTAITQAFPLVEQAGKLAHSPGEKPSLFSGKQGLTAPPSAGQPMRKQPAPWGETQLTFTRPLTIQKTEEIATITAKNTVEKVVQAEVSARISTVHEKIRGDQEKPSQGRAVASLTATVAEQQAKLQQLEQHTKPVADGDVQKLAKAVLREMDAQIRLERQRRGIL